jgi:hypothetical protein
MLKWAGLALSVLILLIWLVSLRLQLMCRLADEKRADGNWECYFQFSINNGLVACTRSSMGSPQSPGWTLSVSSRWPRWKPLFSYLYTSKSDLLPYFWLVLPLWIPFVIVVIPTTYLWYYDRPIPPGHCQKCGYNLTGNVSGVCPECGEKT